MVKHGETLYITCFFWFIWMDMDKWIQMVKPCTLTAFFCGHIAVETLKLHETSRNGWGWIFQEGHCWMIPELKSIGLAWDVKKGIQRLGSDQTWIIRNKYAWSSTREVAPWSKYLQSVHANPIPYQNKGPNDMHIDTGWWFQPLWKIWKPVGRIIPNIWKNKRCSKPPTRTPIFRWNYRNDGESYFSPTEFPPQMTGLAAPSIEPLLKHHEHHLH